MAKRLRVGVVGLGRQWTAYRAALLRLGELLEVRCVCDALHGAAEARRLGCSVAGGVVELVEREDVDVILLLGRSWWGLWPLEQACRVRKPVFCGVSLLLDDAHADALAERVREADLPVLMAHSLAAAPVLERLQVLLEQQLGPARVVRVNLSLRDQHRSNRDLLRSAALPALLAVCAELLGGPPARVWAVGDAGGSVASMVVEEEEGGVAQVAVGTGLAPGSACRIDVAAENGTAIVRFPRTIGWHDAEGSHRDRLPAAPPQEKLLARFAEAVLSGQQPRPGFAEAYEALHWMRAAWRSRKEGRRVRMDELTGAPQEVD